MDEAPRTWEGNGAGGDPRELVLLTDVSAVGYEWLIAFAGTSMTGRLSCMLARTLSNSSDAEST